jgi:hypothetical protein
MQEPIDQLRNAVNEQMDTIKKMAADLSPDSVAKIQGAIDELERTSKIIFEALPIAIRISKELCSLDEPVRMKTIEFITLLCNEKKENPGQIPKPEPPAPPQNVTLTLTTGKRVSLAEHRQKLIKFVRKKGQCTRAGMISGTGIPEGSISALLINEEDFEQVSHGLWKLRDRDTPITSAFDDP